MSASRPRSTGYEPPARARWDPSLIASGSGSPSASRNDVPDPRSARRGRETTGRSGSLAESATRVLRMRGAWPARREGPRLPSRPARAPGAVAGGRRRRRLHSSYHCGRMRAIRVVFLANGVSLGVFFPFTAVILAVRGFSAVEIGVISAISAAAFTLAVPAWGHLADVVLGRRNALAIAALTGAAAVLLAGAPIPALAVAACFVAFSLFESGWGPLGDALAVNAVDDHARDYARVRLLSSVGFATSSAAVGLLYNGTGYGPAFALCAAFAVGLAVAARLTPCLLYTS